MGGSASHSRRFQRRISTTEGGRRGGLGGDGRETGNSCLKQGLNSGRRWRPRKRRMAGESPLLNHHHAESFGRRQVAIYCHRLLAYRAEGSSGSKANGNALTDQRGWVESKQPAPENACRGGLAIGNRPAQPSRTGDLTALAVEGLEGLQAPRRAGTRRQLTAGACRGYAGRGAPERPRREARGAAAALMGVTAWHTQA